jgi:hypothetical protein
LTVKRGRKVFFVDVYYELDCLTGGTTTLVVTSRRKAKKAIRYIRNRCLRFDGFAIKPAWQGDLAYTGWTVDRHTRPPPLRPTSLRSFPRR